MKWNGRHGEWQKYGPGKYLGPKGVTVQRREGQHARVRRPLWDALRPDGTRLATCNSLRIAKATLNAWLACSDPALAARMIGGD
jgi:hypothetical protein